MLDFFILFLLIFLNALFVMSEMALVSAKKNRLEGNAARGDIKSKIVIELKENPDIFLSTTQTYITLIAIITGVYSGEKFEGYLQPYLENINFIKPYAATISTVIVVILVTFLSILFGELVPKRIAIMRPEKIAKQVARPIKILSSISFPIVWLLSSVNSGIFKLLNIKPHKDNQVTEEEIKAMINEGSELGTIEEEEKDIIQRVFHLGDRSITSLMTHRTDIVWFEINENLSSVKEKMKEFQHSVYPLCKENIDEIVGVVYVKDMYLQPDAPLSSILRKALFVPENNSAYQLLEKFKQRKTHYAFIVDEYGTLQGIITLNDILEAIVGDISEVHEEPYEILKRDDGSYLIDAQIPFYDFLSYFNKTAWMDEEEQEEFDTLAGFILHHMERIPVTGDKMEYRGFSFEIIDMDGHRIDKLLVCLPDKIKEEMNAE